MQTWILDPHADKTLVLDPFADDWLVLDVPRPVRPRGIVCLHDEQVKPMIEMERESLGCVRV